MLWATFAKKTVTCLENYLTRFHSFGWGPIYIILDQLKLFNLKINFQGLTCGHRLTGSFTSRWLEAKCGRYFGLSSWQSRSSHLSLASSTTSTLFSPLEFIRDFLWSRLPRNDGQPQSFATDKLVFEWFC